VSIDEFRPRWVPHRAWGHLYNAPHEAFVDAVRGVST
jgi:hypothetical protein